mmetsp:Transcript_12281/g.39288  ORF Transcript_12281/g.39288 Transcript_12281/m.39288 type:complete len:641 (+) Transcript_12281:1-1923(+)
MKGVLVLCGALLALSLEAEGKRKLCKASSCSACVAMAPNGVPDEDDVDPASVAYGVHACVWCESAGTRRGECVHIADEQPACSTGWRLSRDIAKTISPLSAVYVPTCARNGHLTRASRSWNKVNLRQGFSMNEAHSFQISWQLDGYRAEFNVPWERIPSDTRTSTTLLQPPDVSWARVQVASMSEHDPMPISFGSPPLDLAPHGREELAEGVALAVETVASAVLRAGFDWLQSSATRQAVWQLFRAAAANDTLALTPFDEVPLPHAAEAALRRVAEPLRPKAPSAAEAAARWGLTDEDAASWSLPRAPPLTLIRVLSEAVRSGPSFAMPLDAPALKRAAPSVRVLTDATESGAWARFRVRPPWAGPDAAELVDAPTHSLSARASPQVAVALPLDRVADLARHRDLRHLLCPGTSGACPFADALRAAVDAAGDEGWPAQLTGLVGVLAGHAAHWLAHVYARGEEGRCEINDPPPSPLVPVTALRAAWEHVRRDPAAPVLTAAQLVEAVHQVTSEAGLDVPAGHEGDERLHCFDDLTLSASNRSLSLHRWLAEATAPSERHRGLIRRLLGSDRYAREEELEMRGHSAGLKLHFPQPCCADGQLPCRSYEWTRTSLGLFDLFRAIGQGVGPVVRLFGSTREGR